MSSSTTSPTAQAFDRGLLLGIALLVSLLVLNAGLTFHNTRQLREAADRVTHAHQALDALSAVISTAKDAETGQRGFVITGDPEFRQPYDQAVDSIPALVKNLERLIESDSQQQAHLPAMKQRLTAKLDELDRVIQLRKTQGFTPAQEAVLTKRGKQEMDELRKVVSAMEDHERTVLRERADAAQGNYRHAIATGILTALLGLAAVGAFVYTLLRHLRTKANDAAEIFAQREKFRTTLASIGDGVITTDTDGKVTFANAVAQGLIGRSQAEVFGKPLSEVFRIVHEQSREPVDNPALRALAEGMIVGLANHTLLISADGTETPIDDSAAPIRSEDGHVSGAVLVFRDVSQRRRNEESLKEADRQKDQFLAMLAHELRNPLAPIRNALELLSPDTDAETAEWAKQLMLRQVQHIVRLVDDLLDVSRVMRGKIQLRKEPVEISSVIRHAVEEARPAIDGQEQHLALTVPAQPIWVHADPNRLSQIVSNLLNNAAKYTDRQGKIWLEVRQTEGQVEIVVRDSGIGIAPDMHQRIFEPFVQLTSTMDRSRGGLGIGLALVKSLVEMHGGSVRVASDGVGQGSEFIVSLPMTDHSVNHKPQEWKPTPVPPLKILVVDDNHGAADTLARLLRMMWQHEVEVAHDGPGTLAKAEEFQPDLILMDIGLPGMSGYEVAQAIRQHPALQSIFLAALTGYGQEEDRRRSYDAGFDEHLVKPISVVALQNLFAHPKLAEANSSTR